MKYKLKVYTIWEYGQRVDAEGNPHQEDCTFPLPGNVKDTDRLFILCDGMGGHDAGEVASATVCEAMGHSVLKAQPDAEGDFTVSTCPAQRVLPMPSRLWTAKTREPPRRWAPP